MKICPNCKFQNDEESLYCINCGHRLDGLIRCPKCGKHIEKTTKFCPFCGTKINFQEKENSHSFARRKERIDPIFQIIFVAISLFLFLEALTFSWGDIFQFGNNSVKSLFNIPFTMTYFIFSQSFDNPVAIYSVLIALFQLIGTYVVAIIGIVKAIKQLTKKRDCKMKLERYLAIILIINLLSFSQFLSLYSIDYSNLIKGNDFNYTFGYSVIILAVTYVSFFIALAIYETFKIFDRNHRLVFVAKILLSFAFIILPLLIISPNVSSLFIPKYKSLGLYEATRFLLSGDLKVPTAIKSLAVFESIFGVIMSITSAFLFIYLTICYFSKKSERTSFSLPFNVISVFSFAVSLLICLISIIVISYLNNNYTRSDYSFGYGISTITNIVLSFMLASIAVVSFILLRNNRRRQKLMESINKGN